MKKLFNICFLLIGILALGIFAEASFFALKAEATFYYELSDNQTSVVICGVTDCTMSEISIPSTINGLPVTTLKAENKQENGSYAFTSDGYKLVLTTLDLSGADNLTTIEKSTFHNCSNLKGDLYLPSTLTSVGRYAFSGTQISRVFVNNIAEITSISTNSFPSTAVIIYPSKDVMTTYTTATESDKTAWATYTSKYQYTINLVIDGETKSTGLTQIYGDEFADNYDYIMQYLAGYDIVSITQGTEDFTLTSIANGEDIIVETSPSETAPEENTIPVSITYGQDLSISAESVDNAIYNWTWEGSSVSNSTNQLVVENLDTGNYQAVCQALLDGKVVRIDTFEITVNKANYVVSYPSYNRYEIFEFDSEIITEKFNLEEIEYVFYFENTEIEVFSEIGWHEVIVSLTDEMAKNYQIVNPTFEFYVQPQEIGISWATSTYNYTGQIIYPIYVISGNTYGYDVKLVFDDTSVLSAKEVGEYQIVVDGVNCEYFTLSSDAITTFNWKIIETTLTIKWELNSFDYTSSTISPIAYGESGNIRILLDVSESSTGSTNFVDADVYNVTATLPEEYSGFTLQGISTNTLTINPVRLEVVFTSNSTYTYNGSLIEVVAEITSSIQEEVSLILSGNKYKDAGEYTAKVEGVDNSNYYVDDDITFDWKINPKLLVVNWIPNMSPIKYTYNGSVQIPKAQVETGIEDESLTLKIVSDYNKYANEDDNLGYLATATIDESVKNYTLSNSSTRYYITRADAVLSVPMDYSAPYTGQNQLPEYYFVGDEGAVKITLNGLEITNGVKEVGTYEIKFYSVKSKNYNATAEVTCIFTIKQITLSSTSTDGSIKVSATNPNGIMIEELPIEIIADFDTTQLDSIDASGYYLYKAITVGRPNESLAHGTTLTFQLNNSNRDVRMFLITSSGLKEVEVTMSDGLVAINGVQGDYVILVARQNWWTTTAGITTISLIVFALVLGGLMCAIFLRPKKFELDKQINAELEKVIKSKSNNGEQLTTDDIKRIRKQIKDDLTKTNKR